MDTEDMEDENLKADFGSSDLTPESLAETHSKRSPARYAFERWYAGSNYDKAPPELERDDKGLYRLMQTHTSWLAFHAGWLDGGIAEARAALSRATGDHQ